MNLKKFITLIIIGLACISCSKFGSKHNDSPYLLPLSYEIAVAPFTQPLMPAELVTGNLPLVQGKITDIELDMLNRDLREILIHKSSRKYIFIPQTDIPKVIYPVNSLPKALANWIKYGVAHNINFLLIPQVLDWHERQGSEAGVTESASIKLEFFLVDIKNESIMNRFTYEEKQVGLINNILTVGDFMKRKGRWVEATTLAKEGIEKAVQEFGL